MNAVEILERCRKGPEDIQEIAGKIERYRESATSITHFTDGIGGGRASGEPDKVGIFATEIADLEQQKSCRARQHSAEVAASSRLLSTLPNMESEVLHKFYVKGNNLTTIAAKMRFSYGYIRKVKMEGLRQAELIPEHEVREALPDWYVASMAEGNVR